MGHYVGTLTRVPLLGHMASLGLPKLPAPLVHLAMLKDIWPEMNLDSCHIPISQSKGGWPPQFFLKFLYWPPKILKYFQIYLKIL